MLKRMIRILFILLMYLAIMLHDETHIADETLEPNNTYPVYEPVVIEMTTSQPDYLEEEYACDELEYLASCVEAEAGNQGLLGKRYVTAVVLNRVDSDKFPNTITEVIEQPKQFAVVSDGRINEVIPSEETYEAIQLELQNRTDYDILFFRTGKYHIGYEPCFQYKDHYFSK